MFRQTNIFSRSVCGHNDVLINNWLSANTLCLNASRTKGMLFQSMNKYTTDNELLLNLNIQGIGPLDCLKYLDLHVHPLSNSLKQQVRWVYLHTRFHTVEDEFFIVGDSAMIECIYQGPNVGCSI